MPKIYVLRSTGICMLLIPTVERKRVSVPPRMASSLSKTNTLYVQKLSYWSKFKFRKPNWSNLSFGKWNLIGCLIQVSIPQTYVKWTFWGRRSQASVLKELCPLSDKSLRFHLKTRAVKLQHTWQLMDVLSMPTLLNGFMALTPGVKHLMKMCRESGIFEQIFRSVCLNSLMMYSVSLPM